MNKDISVNVKSMLFLYTYAGQECISHSKTLSYFDFVDSIIKNMQLKSYYILVITFCDRKVITFCVKMLLHYALNT